MDDGTDSGEHTGHQTTPPPVGTITFLFTDLEGSTELWERDEPAMRRAVAEHDALVREAIDRHQGYVFTTAGDSFAAAFGVAGDAAAAAIDIQRAMQHRHFDAVGALAVRVGMHTGTAELRDDDYFGPAVNTAARIMSAGHGGQIIISETTAALVPDAALLDLGQHELKGLREPSQLSQLSGPGLADRFPPLRTRRAAASNLPESQHDLLGRERDLATVTKALADTRLVTLVGPGGVGKTSLAIEAARSMLPPDGTWLVDLAPVASDEYVAIAFADAIGLAESGNRPLPAQVVAALRDRQSLLVVDNCEHIIDTAATLIDEILAGAPSVRILATSREVLELPDEAVVPVGPLALPERDASIDELRRSPALQLLDTRSAAADPELDVLTDDPTSCATVCHLVDGLPLAIELAAARLRSMSIAELADHLGERFSILAGGRGRRARHRTLDAVIDWSYSLLDVDEQRSFEQLSVFSGGFTADAAAAVLPAGLGRIEMLARLVDKSLLTADPASTGTRYGMLETLRSFAASRLDERGTGDTSRQAHLEWSLGLVDRLEADMRTPRQDASLTAVRPEHDNLRAARGWAEQRDPVATLRITASAPIDTHHDRQRRLATELAAAPDASDNLRARARYTALGAAFEAGDFVLGIDHGQSAMELYAALGDPSQQAYSEMMLAFCRWGAGHLDDVGPHMEHALTSFDQLGDPMGMAYLSWCTSQWQLRDAADLDATLVRARRAVELFGSVDSPYGTAHAVEGVGHVLAAAGHLDEAMLHMSDAVRQLHRLGHTGCVAHALDGVAFVLTIDGRLLDAAELVGAAERLREDSGAAARPWELDATARCQADLRRGLDDEARLEAMARGREWSTRTILGRVDELAPPT